MRTATWDELDPNARYYGWHGTDDGFVSCCELSWKDASDEASWRTHRVVAAWVNGEHVRVPDGYPPAKATLAELRRASDEAELAWHDDRGTVRAYLKARLAFLRARLAEGDNDG
jgi:hypothetical protein